MMASIRRAVKEDMEVLAGLYTLLEGDAVMYQPEHFVMSGGAARLTEEMFGDGKQVMFVAEEGGKVVGFAHAVMLEARDIPCLRPQRNVYIQDMVVERGCRSCGIGSRLMDAVKQFGRDGGAEFVRTQVFPMNTDGLRFYKKNGFAEKMITIECPLD